MGRLFNSSMETVVYDQSALQKVDLRQTASLRFNNLSYGANHLVYSHRNEVWLMPEPTAAIPKPSPEKFPYADSQLVLQSKICAFEDFALVVIGCAGSLQIWNLATKSRILDFPLSSLPGDSGAAAAYTRGTAKLINDNGNFVCTGTSQGVILIFKVGPNDATLDTQLDSHEGSSITDLATDVEDTSKMASADVNGKIITWQSNPTLDKNSVFAANGMPCTSVKMRGANVITTHPNGTLRILNCATGVAVAEIGGHSRIVNALDIHPTKNMFVTVGEDTYVNVWTLPTEGNHEEIRLLLNAKIDNNLLTGVQFCGNEQATVGVTAYEATTMYFFAPQ